MPPLSAITAVLSIRFSSSACTELKAASCRSLNRQPPQPGSTRKAGLPGHRPTIPRSHPAVTRAAISANDPTQRTRARTADHLLIRVPMTCHERLKALAGRARGLTPAV